MTRQVVSLFPRRQRATYQGRSTDLLEIMLL